MSGIIPPLVTPLNSDDELDIKSLEKLLEHVIGGGVSGVFILGTTGEAPRLSQRLKREMVQETCKIVNQRIPVLVGITDPSFTESLLLAEVAFQNNANALVLAPPFYYPVSQAELLHYFERVALNCKLPVFIYNIPSRTNVNIEIETVIKASKIPGIIGLKDSTGDLVYFHRLQDSLKDIPDFPVFIGPEELTGEAVLFGAAGGVNGGANAFPKLYVAMYNAAKEKNIEKLKILQNIIAQISNSVYTVGNDNPNLIKNLKFMLAKQDICKEKMAGVYIPLSEEEKQEIILYIGKIQIPKHLL